MSEHEIDIRDITETDAMRAVEELQKEVWGMSDRDIVSVFMMAATNAVGGVLVGAYDGGALVGFAYGFVGLEGGRPILHSDMLAVRREWRGRGLGFRLKLAQRERSLTRGLRLMTWTFDPLRAANAHLNFTKLGVLSDSYRENFYGANSSSFLHTAGTDRLWVSWLLDSRRVRERVEGARATGGLAATENLPALVRVGVEGGPERTATEEWSGSNRVVIEIPAQAEELQGRAHEWRLATRRAFTEALGAGFIVVDFFSVERNGRRVGSYLLYRGRSLEEFA